MPEIHETAYPRLNSSVSDKDLKEVYTPSAAEIDLASEVARGRNAKLYFLVLLKTFQRLGYFIQLRDVPRRIVSHISGKLGLLPFEFDMVGYDESGTRRRHIATIRDHLEVRPFDDEGKKLLGIAVKNAAMTKDDLADILNVGIEELVRNRFELPGFTTLDKQAKRGRAEVNRSIYRTIASRLGAEGTSRIDSLLTANDATERALWQQVKSDPGRPSVNNLRKLVARIQWLEEHNVGEEVFSLIPNSKVERFAAEAMSLDAPKMRRLPENKRYTLAASLLRMQLARGLDDIGEMFVKRMRHIHNKAKEALDEFRQRHQGETDRLVLLLHDVLMAMQQPGTAEERLESISHCVGDDIDGVIEKCRAYSTYADNNYTPFMWGIYKSSRQTLFSLLEHVKLISTSQNAALTASLGFLMRHRQSKRDALDIEGEDGTLDLSWVPEKWWKLVTGSANRNAVTKTVDRRQFEVCVFSEVMQQLKSADLCIEGSNQFGDYREELVTWEEYEDTVAEYGEQVGFSTESSEFVQALRKLLEDAANAADAEFPLNDAVSIENGEASIRRSGRKHGPEQLKELQSLIAERIEPVNILDVLADTENWINWSRFFGPHSGFDSKIEEPRERYVTTTFCYGCGLGPTQTSRSVKDFDRRQLAAINQRHISEKNLQEATTEVINGYNRFALPKEWGSGKRVSADGTKWDLYEQNLLSEYHIRYGGYGGIGYYHVSDTYIALFSHFIPCGVWEAVYILDGLMQNESDIQPDTVHSDTQGQSLPVFGLAHLLGIKLMPRIRNWKDLKLFRPSKETRYENIDELFSDAIDWELIETHLPDMLRVAVSIKVGRITPSTILRRLGTYSRKNKLYVAMRELGKVVRTVFLLEYLGDSQLRQIIQSATNKSENFNKFAKWLSFGGDGTITENHRDKQRKLIKYNHLVANCVIFHNVQAMTSILHDLTELGIVVDREVLSRLSPYLTEHINRFGNYTLNLQRMTPAPKYDMPSESRELQAVD